MTRLSPAAPQAEEVRRLSNRAACIRIMMSSARLWAYQSRKYASRVTAQLRLANKGLATRSIRWDKLDFRAGVSRNDPAR